MQFEDGDAEILQGGELYLRLAVIWCRCGSSYAVDLVVVDAQAGLFRGP